MPSRCDVAPDVQLGPVGQREHPHVLAGRVPAVVEVPQLGALAARVPAAELVAQARRSAPWPGPSPRRGGRRRRPRRTGARRWRRAAAGSAAGCGCRPARSASRPSSIQSCTVRDLAAAGRAAATSASRKASTSGKLWPVSTCSSGNGTGAGAERLGRQVQHHDGVLAAGEQHHRPLELAGDLAEDVDRLGLEHVELVAGAGRGRTVAVGRSVTVTSLSVRSCVQPAFGLGVPAQRPARGSSPGATRRVQGAQPIDG